MILKTNLRAHTGIHISWCGLNLISPVSNQGLILTPSIPSTPKTLILLFRFGGQHSARGGKSRHDSGVHARHRTTSGGHLRALHPRKEGAWLSCLFLLFILFSFVVAFYLLFLNFQNLKYFVLRKWPLCRWVPLHPNKQHQVKILQFKGISI